MTDPLMFLAELRPEVEPDPDVLARVRAELFDAPPVPLLILRHRRRRAALVVGALTLLAATAATWAAWHQRDDTSVSCPGNEFIQVVSGDPVRDCERNWVTSHEGDPPPMRAFDNGSGGIAVLLADAPVPDGWIALAPGRVQDNRVSGVEMALSDWGTGLEGDCVSGEAAREIVESEMRRVGLTGWDVRVDPGIGGGTRNCASAVVAETESVIYVRGFGPRTALSLQYVALARRIEAAVTAGCLDLGAAADVVRGVVGSTPITFDDGTSRTFSEKSGLALFTYAESEQACATAQVQVGGAVLVYVRGPER